MDSAAKLTDIAINGTKNTIATCEVSCPTPKEEKPPQADNGKLNAEINQGEGGSVKKEEG